MNVRRLKLRISQTLKIYLMYILVSGILLFTLQIPTLEGLSAKGYSMDQKYPDRVALIESGSEGAQVRLDLIEAARSTIDFSYYTISNGQFTNVLLSCLLAAADRGVKVRILQEGLTHLVYETGPLKEILRGFELHPNIEVKYYEKFNLLTPWAWQNRLHEKIIIVDGELALLGGRNIGNKYFLKDEYKDRYVNDREALICREESQKSVIGDMQQYFDQLWEYKHTKPRRKNISAKQREKGKLSNEKMRAYYKKLKVEHPYLFQKIDWKERTYPTEGVQFVHNNLGRRNTDPISLKTLLHLAYQAETSIFLQSPYIIPTRRMRKVIAEYDIDWDKVSILTNSKRSSPNPLAMAAYFNHRKNIVDTVDQVYEYQGPDSIHSKSYIIDETISVIGTYNLDSRSSYINTESMILITSKRFAQELYGHIQTSIDNSVLVRDDYTYGGEAEEKKPFWLFSKVVGLFEYYL